VGTFSVLSAGLVLGVMIIPTVASLSEDAMSAVPRALREASYGLGANRMRTVLRVVFPAAISGHRSVDRARSLSRAVGETMIVAMAAGSQARMVAAPARGRPDDDRVHRRRRPWETASKDRPTTTPSSPSGSPCSSSPCSSIS
jgi:ABC-type phosphate transport system permease subunit